MIVAPDSFSRYRSRSVPEFAAATIAAGAGVLELGIWYATRHWRRSEPEIYAAGVPSLLQVIANIDESLENAILIGHNPGFEDLSNTLVPGDPIAHLPTCAVVHMRLNVDHWGEAGDGCAELVEHLYPKMFEE